MRSKIPFGALKFYVVRLAVALIIAVITAFLFTFFLNLEFMGMFRAVLLVMFIITILAGLLSVSGNAEDLGLSLNHARGNPALLREESKNPHEGAEKRKEPSKNNGIMLIMVGLTLALTYYLAPMIF